jgi:hypothetical protein
MPLIGEITVQAVRRTKANVNGRWVMTRGEPFTWRATINPVPGDILATLPEGERLGRQYRALSDDVALYPPDEETGYPGDLVLFDGGVYEVRDRANYPTIIPHQELRIRRLLPTKE